MEPSPTALKVVSSCLLPHYGWPHKEAGRKYPRTEKSFRATLNSKNYTRGFTVATDGQEHKVYIKFDAGKVLPKDKQWLSTVKSRNENYDKLEIVPYWGYSDLFSKARTKLLNSFLVIYETKTEGKAKFFHYYKVYKLQELNEANFIKAIEDGEIYIDFDARTGHNHGTKFRMNPQKLISIYNKVELVLDAPKLGAD